ncbi:DUF481 domain-containing protein [Pseudoroseicyclus tamaricis]|uniref:DUF481 domain-containing protein n=1 Tax=Pseudoroseicyclus tamaricis TaxID=2705421 RepID=A0A6B2K1L2_9RHOB|nr:DUF481 domain-containing protein [Pseudoroseicyclus tamaricis]NDV00256.1 DUF481 domain-containing protein [Pseudoroseicyclus tamaricis]
MKTQAFIGAVVASFVATTAFAQTSAFDLEDAAVDEVEDLQEDIADDAERDVFLGNRGRETGTFGSVALRYVANDDANGDDTASLGLGLSYGYYDGLNGFDSTLSYSYQETDGDADTDRLTGSLGYTRDFGPRIFGFADATVRIDRETDEPDDNFRDAFVGFGAGYRVFDTDTMQWTAKAGPGYRYIEKASGEEVDEAAYVVESNYYMEFRPGVAITNDTQLIGSDFDTTVSNDLALSVALSNALSLRTSYVVEFSGSDFDDLDRDSSTIGASVVYSFN